MENSKGQLTNREEEILSCFKQYYAEHCYAPSFREIGKMAGVKSTASVHAYITSLIKKGYIETDAEISMPRAYRITGTKIIFSENND